MGYAIGFRTAQSEEGVRLLTVEESEKIELLDVTSCHSVIRPFYHPRMRVGNVFGHVCLCLSVCLSVCVFLSVQAITFEPLDIETSFLLCR